MSLLNRADSGRRSTVQTRCGSAQRRSGCCGPPGAEPTQSSGRQSFIKGSFAQYCCVKNRSFSCKAGWLMSLFIR